MCYLTYDFPLLTTFYGRIRTIDTIRLRKLVRIRPNSERCLWSGSGKLIWIHEAPEYGSTLEKNTEQISVRDQEEVHTSLYIFVIVLILRQMPRCPQVCLGSITHPLQLGLAICNITGNLLWSPSRLTS